MLGGVEGCLMGAAAAATVVVVVVVVVMPGLRDGLWVLLPRRGQV